MISGDGSEPAWTRGFHETVAQAHVVDHTTQLGYDAQWARRKPLYRAGTPAG